MRPRYKVSQAGVDLIEAFEGLRTRSARLDDGRWTIGYGHTRSAREGAEVSREDALILLRWVDLPPVEEAINALVSVPLTQNQYDALVAFVFNVGIDAFRESEVLQRLNEGRPTEAACALELWRKADIAGDPVVLDALIRRRAAEKALFLADDGAAPTPSPLVRPRPDPRAAQFVPARRPAEIEAPLAGERAEVRLVAPYDVEPEPEAPTALLREAVEAAPAAESAPEAAPTAWTPAAEPEAEETLEAAAPVAPPAVDAALEEAPTAWTAPAAEPEAEETLEAAAPVAPLAVDTALEEAPTAWTAPAAEPAAEETLEAAAPVAPPAAEPEEAPTAWTAPAAEPDAEEALEAAAPVAPPAAAPEEAPTAWTAPAAEPDAEEALEAAAPATEQLPEPAAEEASVETSAAAEPATVADAALTAMFAWAVEIAEGAEQPATAVVTKIASSAWTVESPTQETAETALAAWTAEPANEAEPEPAASAEAAGTSEAPAEALPDEAPTAWTAEVVEQAAQAYDSQMAWSMEAPQVASVVPQETAPAAWAAEPSDGDWEGPAPSSWIVGVTRPAAEPALAAAVQPVEPEPEAAVEVPVAAVSEPEAPVEVEAEAEAEAAAAPEPAPAAAPEGEETVREVPAVSSVLQTRAIPEVSPRPRPLYSSYGPMAFAVAPPPALVETPPATAGEGAAMAAPARPQPVQPKPVQPQPVQAPTVQRQPHFQPLPELPVPAAESQPARPEPGVAPPVPGASQAPATEAAAAKPLILTSPPADWDEPRAAKPQASLAAEADELETPLFDEGWDGPGALSGRIVHHEAPVEHDARATKIGVTGPYVLLGFIGFVAFGGALFAFSRGHTANGGAGNPVILAWILALIGAACVGISVYFLLKRLGGQED